MNRPFEFFVKDKAPDWTPNEWTKFYTALNSLKHSRPELSADASTGSLITYSTTSPDVLVFERRAGKSRSLVGVNLGKEETPVTFTGMTPNAKNAKAAMPGSSFSEIPTSLKPGEYFFLTID